MNAKDLLRRNIDLSHEITRQYVSDLSDADMLVRPLPNANHAAWQLGHLVSSEHSLLSAAGGSPPELPDGFAAAHSKEAASSDDTSGYLKKDEYLAWMQKMHQASLAYIETVSEAAMDKPAPEEMQPFFPTIGAILLMLGGHEMMHVGQLATIRRNLDKPILI